MTFNQLMQEEAIKRAMPRCGANARQVALVEREAAYQVALMLVGRVDEELTRGIRHYRSRAGALLTTLDEVVRAILDNNLETRL